MVKGTAESIDALLSYRQATLWLLSTASVRCKGCVSAWIWPTAPASTLSKPLLGAWITWSCRDWKDQLSIREESEWKSKRGDEGHWPNHSSKQWHQTLAFLVPAKPREQETGGGVSDKDYSCWCLLTALQWDTCFQLQLYAKVRKICTDFDLEMIL